jgi:hypothetical protein
MAITDFTDAQYKSLCPVYTAAPTEVSLSTTTAVNGTALAAGWYMIQCDADCYIKQGAAAQTATANDWRLPANQAYPMSVDGASTGYLAGIVASGTATLQILKVG